MNSNVTKSFLLIFVIWIGSIVEVHGQAGLRETLDKMDKNKNGYLDPDEITPLSRPFLERILGRGRGGRSRNIYFGSESIPISRIQQSARYYFSRQNGVEGSDVRPKIEKGIKDFSLNRDDPIVPDFGIAEVKFPYIKADLDEADSTMRRCDANRDGLIDQKEAERNRWTHRNPFADDLNKDGKLSRLELAQRYARRRLVTEDSGQLWQKQIRTGGEIKPSVTRSSSYSRYSSRGTAYRIAYDLLYRFDSNRDSKLDANEVKAMGFPISKLDEDRNDWVSQAELQKYMAQMQAQTDDAVDDLPPWFIELDKNQNEQIEMVEFTEEWTEAKLKEFADMDANSDGILSAKEVSNANVTTGIAFVSDEPSILAPKKTIVTVIEIKDDIKIEKLQVTMSITHSYVSHLDGFLVGPDGEKIELFTAVGGSGDHFNKTVFDDTAPASIAKSRAPYSTPVRPESLDKKKPGLGHYKGKMAKGKWKLMIASTRSDRHGLLHQWGLNIVPDESSSALFLVADRSAISPSEFSTCT